MGGKGGGWELAGTVSRAKDNGKLRYYSSFWTGSNLENPETESLLKPFDAVQGNIKTR